MAISTGAAILGAGALAAGATYLGSKKQEKSAKEAAGIQRDTSAAALAELRPYREFGASAMDAYRDLAGLTLNPTTGKYEFTLNPTAAENYAIDRGRTSLTRFLRSRGNLGSTYGDQAMNDYEMKAQLGLLEGRKSMLRDILNVGTGNTATAANIMTGTGTNLSNLALKEGEAKSNLYSGIANLGLAGANAYMGYKGQQDLLAALRTGGK